MPSDYASRIRLDYFYIKNSELRSSPLSSLFCQILLRKNRSRKLIRVHSVTSDGQPSHSMQNQTYITVCEDLHFRMMYIGGKIYEANVLKNSHGTKAHLTNQNFTTLARIKFRSLNSFGRYLVCIILENNLSLMAMAKNIFAPIVFGCTVVFWGCCLQFRNQSKITG